MTTVHNYRPLDKDLLLKVKAPRPQKPLKLLHKVDLFAIFLLEGPHAGGRYAMVARNTDGRVGRHGMDC